jgi:FlaA1/EpsC-like NDP-sugar epimerase
MRPILASSIITFFSLFFLGLLTAKLNTTSVSWNWFIVFIPLFILQVFYLIELTLNLIRSQFDFHSKNKQFILIIVCILLIYAFEFLLCLKLEYFNIQIKLTYVFIPLWLVLILICAYLMKILVYYK